MRTFALLLLAVSVASADKVTTERLIEMARNHTPELEQALRDTLGAEAIQKGTAVAGQGADFVWAVATDQEPLLQIDLAPPVSAFKAGSLWVYQGKLQTGTAHKFIWIVGGKSFGGANNIPAFAPDSYPQSGVPQGKLTGPIEFASKIYPDMKANVWYYVPAQYDGSTPLAVQIWGDGQMYVERPGNYHVLDTLDNLTAKKRVPPMVNIFIQPGMAGERRMRSIEYDSVNDTYARYLLEEILPEIGTHVKLRQDGYSRAMVGESSGGICAFNAAWFKPDQFSRVLSWIGSFADLHRTPGEPHGGYVYPLRARQEEKRNIRVWLQDGAEDQENPRAGSWPLANIELANSLKMKGYDYHFTFGFGTHNQSQGAAQLPESLPWLWRDYDPAKTSQEFVQDAAEKDKPLWRIVTMNRD
ncbi:MAG TPA: alpha/beta hydrolase-fold protein [Bryobacteraceae bacterium]|nr:alpha/beta hydrolase-fold protein [Bryobacteraceae bacterium]